MIAYSKDSLRKLHWGYGTFRSSGCWCMLHLCWQFGMEMTAACLLIGGTDEEQGHATQCATLFVPMDFANCSDEVMLRYVWPPAAVQLISSALMRRLTRWCIGMFDHLLFAAHLNCSDDVLLRFAWQSAGVQLIAIAIMTLCIRIFNNVLFYVSPQLQWPGSALVFLMLCCLPLISIALMRWCIGVFVVLLSADHLNRTSKPCNISQKY